MPEITFNPTDHTYWADGRQLTSVTTLVKSVTPPFDKEKIAARCARKEGKTVEQILASWEAKGEVARTRGTAVHAYAEDVLDGRHDGILDALNERYGEMDAFDVAWLALRERLDAKVVWKEKILGDPSLGVAGRADVMLDVLVGGERKLSLMDYKTGRQFETRGRWASLLPPFADLTDCELSRYSLQLSIYRLLLERTEPAAYGDPYLIHLKENGTYRSFRALDLRERALGWLVGRAKNSTLTRAAS